jgi:predicted phosphatase
VEDKNPIEGTIFEDYDTIIFDLDQTLMDCFTADGTSIGAYQTTPPYELKDVDTILDLNGKVIKLQEGVHGLIELLDKNSINLGIVSRSEVKDTLFEAQPAVMLLKKFDIYKYFNYEVVFKRVVDKADYVKPLGKTLFIDDYKEELDVVNARGSVDVLWRRSFPKWESLLEPKNQQLGFGKMAWKTADPLLGALDIFKKYKNDWSHEESYTAQYDITITRIPPENMPTRDALCYDVADEYIRQFFHVPMFDYLEELEWVDKIRFEVEGDTDFLLIKPLEASKIDYFLHKIRDGSKNFYSDLGVEKTLGRAEKIQKLDDYLQEFKSRIQADLDNPGFWTSELYNHLRAEVA